MAVTRLVDALFAIDPVCEVCLVFCHLLAVYLVGIAHSGKVCAREFGVMMVVDIAHEVDTVVFAYVEQSVVGTEELACHSVVEASLHCPVVVQSPVGVYAESGERVVAERIVFCDSRIDAV